MSGIAYNDAKLQLVAGDVNQVSARARAHADAAGDVGGRRHGAREDGAGDRAFEYHLYSLDRPTTLKENQTKQVALLAAAAIPVSQAISADERGAARQTITAIASARWSASMPKCA